MSIDAADFPSMTQDQKAEMERQRKEVAERRAIETKEQQRTEAARREQGK